MERRTVVVYGGSFCPVHIGHIMVGGYVGQFVEGVDHVMYMLSARNPLKPPYPMTDSERLALLSRAVAPYPFMSVSSLELSMPVPATPSTLSAVLPPITPTLRSVYLSVPTISSTYTGGVSPTRFCRALV